MSKLLEQINKERKTLGSVLEVTSSKRIYLSEYKNAGVPFFRSKEIIEASRGKEISSELYISNKRYSEVKDKYGVPQVGDILLTSIGTIGIPFIVKDNTPFYFKDGNLTWFKNYNGIEPYYLYYWITSKKGQSQIEGSSIGSSQSALTIDSIKKLEIDLPNVATQNKIAEILSTYDLKIENNNKIIKNLEATAQTIFNEWFVNFRLPAEILTKAGFPDGKIKMVESEMGEIPEGWEVGEIEDVVTRLSAQKTYKEDSLLQKGTIPVYDQSSKGTIGFHEEEASFSASIDNPILIFGDHTCRTQVVCEPFSLGPNTIPLGEKDGYSPLFTFFLTKDVIEQREYKRHWSELSSLEFVIPPAELAKTFVSKVKSFVSMIIELEKENTKLKESRDQLLAKLI